MTNSKSEPGIAHVLVVLLGAAVIAAVGFAALNYVHSAHPSAVTPSPSPSAKPSTSPTAHGKSGVKGSASIGPTKPTCTASDPCERPYRLSYPITVTPGLNGQSSSSLEAGSDGTFQVDLQPGTYHLIAKSQLSQDTKDITVKAGQYEPIVFSFDSGIR